MLINKILKNLVLGGSFIIPFIPFFFFNNTFFPYITGKNFGFRVITLLMFSFYLVLALRSPEYRPKFSWIMASVLAFTLIIGLSNLFGQYPYKSFWSNYERMEGYITILHLVGYLLAITAVVTTSRYWDYLLKTSIGASVMVSFYGISQLMGSVVISQGGVRLDGPFGNAAYMAVYILIHIFLVLYYWLGSIEKDNYSISWLYAPIFLLETFILYQTATRGALLGLLGGLIISGVLLLIFEKKNKKIRKISGIFIMGVGIIIGGFLLTMNTKFIKESPVLSRFASISLDDNTTKSRIVLWNVAYQGFLERPIRGWGQENFSYVFNKYFDPSLYGQEQWFDRAHNVFFDWLIAGGILGLLAYLAMFGVAIYTLWKSSRFSITEKSLMTGLFGAYFCHNFFVFDNLVSLILFFTLLGFIHTKTTEDEIPLLSKVKLNKTYLRIISTVIMISTITIFYISIIKPLSANTILVSTFNSNITDDKRLEYLNDAYSLETFANSEISEQAYAIALNRSSGGTSDIYKEKYFKLAEKMMLDQIEKTPTNSRYLSFLSSFYSTYNINDKAIIYMERAIASSPQKQVFLGELARLYLMKEDVANSIAIMKKAYELDPSIYDFKRDYIAILIYSRNTKLAEDLLNQSEQEIYRDGKIAVAFASIGDIVRAINIIEKNINTGSEHPAGEYHTLSALYLSQGNKTEAIKAIKRGNLAKVINDTDASSIIMSIQEGKNPFREAKNS